MLLFVGKVSGRTDQGNISGVQFGNMEKKKKTFKICIVFDNNHSSSRHLLKVDHQRCEPIFV